MFFAQGMNFGAHAMDWSRKIWILSSIVIGPLILSPAHAQTWKQIEGIWCSKDEGCAQSHTFYKVEVGVPRWQSEETRIDIRRHTTGEVIFRGKIGEPKVKWAVEEGSIQVQDGSEFKFHATVGLSGANNEIEGIITGSFFRGPSWKGTLTFQGSTEAEEGTEKRILRTAADAGFEGRIKGKIEIKVAEHQGSMVGVFDAKLAMKKEGTHISGVYIPPPVACSFIGRPLGALKWSTKEERYYRMAVGGKKGALEVPPRGELLSVDYGQEQRERQHSGAQTRELEATAQEIRVPREEVVYGKFARAVVGVIGSGKDKITLTLPALAVPDRKCTVTRAVPSGELLLVKQ
jgi:hypothetical protein